MGLSSQRDLFWPREKQDLDGRRKQTWGSSSLDRGAPTRLQEFGEYSFFPESRSGQGFFSPEQETRKEDVGSWQNGRTFVGD
jgi:hypothetical protein